MAESNVSTRSVARARQREFVTRGIADETLIVPVAGGVGDLDAIYTLNEVAARIWALLENPTTVERIVQEVRDSFEVSAEQAMHDVVEFLDALAAAGLIEWLEGPHGAAP